jgi:type I restriction enzyme M protein
LKQKKLDRIYAKKTQKMYIKDFVTGKPLIERPEEIEARQVFERRLVEEYGYSKNQIDIEYGIQKGSHRIGPADIVVFSDSKKNRDNLYIIVETKRLSRKDGIEQLKSYLIPSTAKFGVWFNGKETEYLSKIEKPPYFKSIRDIPRKNERLEDIGKYRRNELIPASNLKSIFKTIYYHLYTNSNLPRAERLAAEMIRLLFCKIYDEMNNDRCQFRAGVDEPEIQVKNRIEKLFGKVTTEHTDVFDKNEKLRLDEKSIAYVVGELQRYSLLKTDKDAVGDAFEVFIGPALRGEKGQFFTPRNLVRMCVKMLDPQPRELIIDPACGSGGFLIVSLEHVWSIFDAQQTDSILNNEQIGQKKNELASRYFNGIDKEFDLAKVTKAYMAIVGDGRGGIFCEDSLENIDLWSLPCLQRIGLNMGKFDVLLTNPPFGSKIPITDRTLLKQYDLGHKWKKDKKTGKWKMTDVILKKQVPQILFIERCLQFLKPNGRMAIVLPEGILGNITDGWIRQFILDKARILAVVDCPTETFQPSTSTKTGVLLLQKKNENQTSDYPIFMAVAEKCGHDRRGKEIYKTDTNGNYVLDEKGNRIRDDDFLDIASAFTEFREKYNVQF